MIVGADKIKDQLLDQNESGGVIFKMKRDPKLIIADIDAPFVHIESQGPDMLGLISAIGDKRCILNLDRLFRITYDIPSAEELLEKPA
jgi:hypothetical protein